MYGAKSCINQISYFQDCYLFRLDNKEPFDTVIKLSRQYLIARNKLGDIFNYLVFNYKSMPGYKITAKLNNVINILIHLEVHIIVPIIKNLKIIDIKYRNKLMS